MKHTNYHLRGAAQSSTAGIAKSFFAINLFKEKQKMAITWRSFRAAWNTFVGQSQSNQAKATGEAGVLQGGLRQQQLVEESNRLERFCRPAPSLIAKPGHLFLFS